MPRHVVSHEGFTDFAGRPARLRHFLAEYGWTGGASDFLGVVRDRVRVHAAGVRDLAAAGESLFGRLVEQGVADDLDVALTELEEISP